MNTHVFEEQQQFRQPWMYLIYFLLLALFGLFIYADIQQIILGKPFGDQPPPGYVLVLITVFLPTFLIIFYQVKLQTLITDEGVFFRWLPVQKKYKKLSWSDIQKVEIIHYRFIGYGWRLTRYGIVHNVAGDKGLRLTLRSGRRLVLGTQKPHELARFLEQIDRLHERPDFLIQNA